jgi:hypothetical protein
MKFILTSFLMLASCAPMPMPIISGPVGTQGPQGPVGAQGPQGPAGNDAPPTAYTPTALLNPCGDAAGIADEVLIQLADGTIVASYGSGNAVRFATLTNGNYITTDGDACYFTVAAGVLTNEHH